MWKDRIMEPITGFEVVKWKAQRCITFLYSVERDGVVPMKP